jgi:ribosomal 50S subunit-associated protein YjgA (DUF615 family)
MKYKEEVKTLVPKWAKLHSTLMDLGNSNLTDEQVIEKLREYIKINNQVKDESIRKVNMQLIVEVLKEKRASL